MPTASLVDVQHDRIAMSVARALALANETALKHGTQPANSLVTVTEEMSLTGCLWRIHYGPRDFLNRRGGDLIVVVDEQTASVLRIIRGQ